MDIHSPFHPERKLTRDERRLRVVSLCCSFMRNLAFHRAGLRHDVQRRLFNSSHPRAAFWREVHVNFLDICVLDWCKLFADPKGKHHWQRVIDNHDRFEADLYATLSVSVDDFGEMIEKARRYRNKFVAHLDDERMMHPPILDVPKKSVAFLHERLLQRVNLTDAWRLLPTTAAKLEQGYEQAFQEAWSVYDDALRAPLSARTASTA
jgi:hypothetical protein